MSNKNDYLQDLITQAESQGGVMLRIGQASRAVVLSIDKYNELVAGKEEQADFKNSRGGKILITGGAGYVGSHALMVLQDSGYEAVVLDNLSTGRREFVPDAVPFYQGDYGDKTLLAEIFATHDIYAVMHFGASLEVAESVEKPLEYLENNVVKTQYLLEAMHTAGVRNIIFSSTGAVYGDQEKMPIPETAELRPNNPYGYTKVLGERLIEYFCSFAGFRARILRYFNVCGAESLGRLGDTHINSHLIPIVLEVAQGKRDRLVINGNDYPTFDGTCVRDFIHVLDIAEAHRLALESLGAGEALKTYNVGTGKGTSVEQIITACAEVLNRMVPIEIGPRRPGDAAITVADTQRIRDELGFVPRFSDLETVIKTSWNRMNKQ